jgi:hypothetical protein
LEKLRTGVFIEGVNEMKLGSEVCGAGAAENVIEAAVEPQLGVTLNGCKLMDEVLDRSLAIVKDEGWFV